MDVKAEAGGGRGRGPAASRASILNLSLEAEDLELVGLRGFAHAHGCPSMGVSTYTQYSTVTGDRVPSSALAS